MANPRERERAEPIIRELCELFPKCFFLDPSKRVPLKKNIERDILKLNIAELNSGVHLAVEVYIEDWGYQRSLVAGEWRIDLDGNSTNRVTDQEARAAERTIQTEKAELAARRQPNLHANPFETLDKEFGMNGITSDQFGKVKAPPPALPSPKPKAAPPPPPAPEPPPVQLFECKRCHVAKPADEYGLNSNSTTGRQAWCKVCMANYHRDRRGDLDRPKTKKIDMQAAMLALSRQGVSREDLAKQFGYATGTVVLYLNDARRLEAKGQLPVAPAELPPRPRASPGNAPIPQPSRPPTTPKPPPITQPQMTTTKAPVNSKAVIEKVKASIAAMETLLNDDDDDEDLVRAVVGKVVADLMNLINPRRTDG
jgi:hypothetical protein